MPKKTILAGGMLSAAVVGGIITSVPASAQAPADGGSSHSRNKFAQLHHSRNWNGSENEDLNHIRLRLRNRNNNIAVARTRQEKQEKQEKEVILKKIIREVKEMKGRCIATEVMGKTKFVALTRGGQLFVQEVTLTPKPEPGTWANATSVFTAPPNTGFTPSCVALAVEGNNLHITALGADGRVLQSACRINPQPIQFPGDCSDPINLGPTPALAAAFRANLRQAGTTPVSATRQPSGRRASGV